MSNIKTEKVQYNGGDFIKKEISTDEIRIKSEYDEKYKGKNSLKSSESSHSKYHHHQEGNAHSCYYNTSSSVPKTILITNNYSQNDGDLCLTNKNINKSSITIVTHNSDTEHSPNTMPISANNSTVVLDRINICINNHFNDTRPSVQNSSLVSEKSYKNDSVSTRAAVGGMKSPLVTSTASTTSDDSPSSTSTVVNPCLKTSNVIKDNKNDVQNSISNSSSSTSTSCSSSSVPSPSSENIEGQDSVKSESAAQYSIGQDVLVQKKDGLFYLGTVTAVSRFQCLVKFDDNTEYWSLFSELTKLNSTDTNADPVCVVCKKITTDVVEVCERCGRGYHQKCTNGSFQKKGIWFCRRCTAPNGARLKSNDKNESKVDGTSNQISHKSQLPYDLDSLKWDKHHRVNLEQIYCYCGRNGEWYNKMLQCSKCEQWFHEKCVQCLDYPVYCGDRFYVFVCSMCNYGKEFLRRVEMKWVDVVHLLLFNITINNQKKYYHINKVIIPYAIDNWHMLQLNQNMKTLPPSEIKEKILKTLSGYTTRFKCGREIKKRQSVWGLRLSIPPPVPPTLISKEVHVTDQYLRQTLKLNIISKKPLVNIPKDTNDKLVKTEYTGENSDTSGTGDHKQLSDDELPLKVIMEKESKRVRESNKSTINETSLPDKQNALSQKVQRSERVDGLLTNDDSNANDSCGIDSSDKSRDCHEYNRVKDDVDETTKNNTFNRVSLQHTKHSRKRKSPFLSSRLQTSASINASETKHTTADIIDICDSSDETSSRGTLDLIIPPPKNFQGRNNPFRLTPKKDPNNANSPAQTTQNGKDTTKQPSNAALSLFSNANDRSQTAAGQYTIVRTVKRRLSAKDIMIGPNKEVKRRRLRRRSGNVEVISTATIQNLPKAAAYLPIRTDSKDWSITVIRSSLNSASSSTSSTPQATTPTNLGSIASVFNGRRLRQRQEKNYAETPRRNSTSGIPSSCSNMTGSLSIPGSPNKSGSQSDVSLSDLKSTVNMYFGAANRIANGENFSVRAKRIGPNGKVQYLIEWEGMP